jgi:hypothetical protein
MSVDALVEPPSDVAPPEELVAPAPPVPKPPATCVVDVEEHAAAMAKAAPDRMVR